ncbi:hypothetical protein CH063_14364 [Colletotrichum higginsianum]|uniref:Uncharacterized protein n=1 Tax=Colletotrichum higginsianum (strain IMI 349063) TaxID=759273 RepID=H1VY99_COLHI|nr:hypothetical protein CH063_14364 [Colletotrichum higginsianum]
MAQAPSKRTPSCLEVVDLGVVEKMIQSVSKSSATGFKRMSYVTLGNAQIRIIEKLDSKDDAGLRHGEYAKNSQVTELSLNGENTLGLSAVDKAAGIPSVLPWVPYGNKRNATGSWKDPKKISAFVLSSPRLAPRALTRMAATTLQQMILQCRERPEPVLF